MKLIILDTDWYMQEIANHFRNKGIAFEKKYIEQPGRDTPSRVSQSKTHVTSLIKDAIGDCTEPRIITAYGNGIWHHYTYGLLNIIADTRSENFTYIHIDHHSDSYPDPGDMLWCGGFVEKGMSRNVSSIVGIGGFTNNDLSIPKFDHLTTTEELEHNMRKLKSILREIPNDVYISCDLDVLDPNEISTDYNQGRTSLSTLVKIINIIRDEKNIISADLLGYKPDKPERNKQSYLTYEKVYQALVGSS